MSEPIDAGVKPAAGYRYFGTYRFLLALMVLFQHFQYLLTDDLRWPFRRWGLGIIAVDLFFVISGFIIAEANTTFYTNRPWNFLGNRLLRILPPYAVALTLSVIVHQILYSMGVLEVWDFPVKENPVSLHGIGVNILLLFPGASKAFEGDFQFIPFVWSLRAELLFYFFAFLFSLAAVMRPGFVGAKVWRGLMATGVLGLGFAFLAIFFVRHSPALLGNTAFFLVGVFLFLWSKAQGGAKIGYAVLAAVSAALSFAAFPLLIGDRFPWIKHEQMIILFVIGLVLVWLINFKPADKGFRNIDRSLGDLSYPLYLNHYVVGIVLFDVFQYRGIPLYLLGIVLSLVAAKLMDRVVEAPLRHIRNRIRGAAV